MRLNRLSGLSRKLTKYFTGTNKPHVATLEEWAEWESNYKSKYPFAFFWCESVPRFIDRKWHRIKRIPWWFKYRFHPHHRYNVLRTGQPPGYYELEDRICLGIFYEFCHFYKHHKSHCCWTSHFGPNKLDDIYNYITVDRRKTEFAIEEFYRTGKGAEASQLEQQLDIKDGQVLCEIIKIRGFLWT